MPRVKFGREIQDDVAEIKPSVAKIKPVRPQFKKVTECDGVLQVDWNGFAILNFADRLSPVNTKDWFDMSLVGKTGHFRITVEWWEKKETEE